MTERKQSIIQSALHLFANEGFNAVSTQRIAKQASVSEGLIFRHFGNKSSLLQQLMQQASEHFGSYIQDPTDDQAVIQKIMELPFHLSPDEQIWWRFIYKMKWNGIREAHQVTDQLKQPLANAFRNLGYAQEYIEADLLLSYVHGFATTVLAEEHNQPELILRALRTKYTG